MRLEPPWGEAEKVGRALGKLWGGGSILKDLGWNVHDTRETVSRRGFEIIGSHLNCQCASFCVGSILKTV